MQRFLLATIVCFVHAAAVPPPTEYTMAMLEQDLHDARLVALVTVTAIDSGSGAQFEWTTLRIDSTFKGGPALAGESNVHVKRQLNLVGGYEPDFRVGEQSYLCFDDQWHDGFYLAANARAKFDITADDSVEAPPVGLGFSDELATARTVQSFAGLLSETIGGNEWLSVSPILATPADSVILRTSIDLSGGTTLDAVMLNTAAQRLDMRLLYTPCSGACPSLFLIKDTSAAVVGLPAGNYVAYRYEQNSEEDTATLPAPDDSVRFTVYGAVSVPPASAPESVPQPRQNTGDAGGAYDLRGRALSRTRAAGLLLYMTRHAAVVRPVVSWREGAASR